MLAGKRPYLAPLDAGEELLAGLRQNRSAPGVSCAVAAAYTGFGGSVAPEVPLPEMQSACVEDLCRVGTRLGASTLRAFTAYEAGGRSPEALGGRVVTCFREVCDRAARHGLTVAIQNHHDLAVHTTALLEPLRDVGPPNAGLGFDAWSPALRGEDPDGAARPAAPHAVLTANADYVRRPRFWYRPELVRGLDGGELARMSPAGGRGRNRPGRQPRDLPGG